MKHFYYKLLFLIVISCKNKNEIKYTEFPSAKLSELDSSLSSLNVKGDSVSYHNWSAEDEMLGMDKPAFGDLDSMIARRYIRVLVPYSKTYYHIVGKTRGGFSYDVLNLFEKELNRELGFNPPHVRIIFIPVSRKEFLPLLTQGYADMVVGGYTITTEREKIVDFSIPSVLGMKEIIVGGPAGKPLRSLSDLSNKTVFVHEESSYQASLNRLNDSLRSLRKKPIRIKFLDPYLEVEDILEMVDSGLIPYTATGQDVGELWEKVLDSLHVYSDLVIDHDVVYGWAFRKNSPQLKATVDRFLDQIKKGTLSGNMLYDKHLRNSKRIQNAYAAEALSEFKKYMAIFQKYGKMYKLDWLLLAAQGYQESKLNHSMVSTAGAVGIMQLLPSTAAGPPINIRDLNKVENNVHAGTKYMRYLIDEYFNDEPMDSLNKHLFALAAYNCGPGMVSRLRKEARERNIDPNQWFNHVEKLAERHIGNETVRYVSNIYKYYIAYRQLLKYKQMKEARD